jgi:hypothetical protein
MTANLRNRRDDEDGVALVTVLLLSMIMLLIVAGTMAAAMQSMPISRRDQDWSAALAAAEAGIDDYLFRLNENDQYYLYSASLAPPDGNLAFTAWVPVPGATASTTCPTPPPTNVPCFRYAVNTANLVSQGAILLTSTGRVNNVTRVVQTTLRRKAFIDYLYFTDFETRDPAAYTGSPFTPAEAQVECPFYRYAGRDPNCTNIYFNDYDTINGPLHTNDAIGISGDPEFNGKVTTGWNTSAPRYFCSPTSCSGSSPTFQPGDPKYGEPLTMPPSNAGIKADADQTQGGTGCLFTGPTSITLNSAGTMTVVSPFTKWPATPNNCQPGSNIPLPSNGVIYVQNVPSTASDPNYTAGCITATQINNSPTVVNHPLGYPQRYDITTYGCRNGDVFLQGTLNGRLTIAAENNIDIIGNVTYQGGTGGDDLLGLIANNYIEIYHPVGSSSAPSSCRSGSAYNSYYNLELFSCSSTTFSNPTVQAAILSVNHSFRVQNYDKGALMGNITINGAIAQRYRGIVTIIGSSGYGKNYNYDQRLKYQSPPRFLQPIAAAWQVVTWIEQAKTNGFAWDAP